MSTNLVSVSKGVFVYKHGNISDYKRSKSTQEKDVESESIFNNRVWFRSYRRMCHTIEKKIELLNNEMFAKLLSSLIETLKVCYGTTVTEIPTTVLLTGVNMPDHSALFTTLSSEVHQKVTPHIAVLQAENSQNLKNVVENMIYQLVNDSHSKEEFITEKKYNVRKSQCTFSLLQAWYEKLYGSTERRTFSSAKRNMRDKPNILAVIIPDFEGFSDKVIQDFILILSSYLNVLPFVLIFGVATSLSAVHKALPYHVSSKISVQIFNSHQSATYLNNVIEKVFFTEDCLFHLGGKVFNLFTDIFLFYDLSVQGFIRNFKFAMLEHFRGNNAMGLCTHPKHSKKILDYLDAKDLTEINQLPSVLKLMEQLNRSEKSDLNNDENKKTFISEQLHTFFYYITTFHIFLKCLHILVHDLPKAPLGKHIRTLYTTAISKSISKTPEFQECFQLLGFQSKTDLSVKIKKLIDALEHEIVTSNTNKKVAEDVQDKLEEFLEEIENATNAIEEMELEQPQEDLVLGKIDRRQLKEKLLEMSKKTKPQNKYEQVRAKLLKYLENIFQVYLVEPTSKPFHEIFFFNDMTIKGQIIGSHRAAIHTALSNPDSYLQCKCCILQEADTILPTMPDISILYKLHLEYGKLINLYDWLQSFLSIVDPDGANQEDERKVVPPELHARFTQAIADLEFMGFIKSSKRKTDHVMRLTWGG